MTKILPISAYAQHHIIVSDIVEDIVLTKDGGAALVLRSTALNFSLLSENEQEAVTLAYAALINSLSFTIQILVRSQKKDITRYLNYLDEQEKVQTNQKLKSLMLSYRTFISQTVKKRNVLEKEFYMIIPFSPFELGVTPSNFISTVTSKKTKRLPFSKEYVIKKTKTVLYPKRDHLSRQVGRLGIRVEQLTTEELATLLFKIYNPENLAEEPLKEVLRAPNEQNSNANT